jgi:ABC-type Mn2+/Zn2+ transport system ATPase subunit
MQLESIGKRYGRGPWLFAGVCLQIEPGQVVAIGGANGSGKSTLLNLLTGLSRPTVGLISDLPRRIGYVPERFPATSTMSAAAYLTHMGRIRGLPTDHASRAAAALLERFHFTGRPDSALRTLSKGNAQKLALAQALLAPPDLLVLDEPWTGLDAAGATVLAGIIPEISALGAMVVLSAHPGVPGPVIDATRYLLAAGSLRSAPGSTPAAPDPAPRNRVLLRRGGDATELSAGWSAQCFISDLDPAVMICTVATAECDRFLLDGLGRGWSVISVGPADAPQPLPLAPGTGPAAGGNPRDDPQCG